MPEFGEVNGTSNVIKWLKQYWAMLAVMGIVAVAAIYFWWVFTLEPPIGPGNGY